MDNELRRFLYQGREKSDSTHQEISKILQLIEGQVKNADFTPSTSYGGIRRLVRLKDQVPNAFVILSPQYKDRLQEGIEDYTSLEYSRFILEEMKLIYEAGLPEVARLDLTDGEYQDKLNDDLKKALGDKYDKDSEDLCSKGIRVGLFQILKEFSGRKPLGFYTQTEIERIANGNLENFGESFTLPTKFPEINVEYYFVDGESEDHLPVISLLIDPRKAL